MTTASSPGSAEPRARDPLPRVPSLHDVLLEQLRATGFALRIPILIAAAAAVLGTLVLAIQVVSGDMEARLHVEPSALPGFIGVLLAIAIWAREERFGPGFLWTLPVDRTRHALTKVLAGWLWLMGGVALYALCQLVLALLAGSRVLPVETLHVLTTPVYAREALDPALLRTLQWAPGPLIWAVPFAGATAAYLLASAVMVGIRYPLRWALGAALLVPLSSIGSHVASRLTGWESLAEAPMRAASLLITGRYGLDSLLKLRTWSLDRRVTLTTGEPMHVWLDVPDVSDWGLAALLWIGAGLLALWVAASRHRERRRS